MVCTYLEITKLIGFLLFCLQTFFDRLHIFWWDNFRWNRTSVSNTQECRCIPEREYHPFCIAQKNRCNPRLLLWRKHASFGFCKNSNILISPFVMLILLLRLLLHLSGWARSHFWFSVNHFSILKNILNCFLDCFIVAKWNFCCCFKIELQEKMLAWWAAEWKVTLPSTLL